METMILGLPVQELHSSGIRAISSVYGRLVEPIENSQFRGYMRAFDHFSTFNSQYKIHEEHEFIAELIEQNPGKYRGFVISYSESN